jgi:hypothetical protein
VATKKANEKKKDPCHVTAKNFLAQVAKYF